jgi:hypothetical protein
MLKIALAKICVCFFNNRSHSFFQAQKTSFPLGLFVNFVSNFSATVAYLCPFSISLVPKSQQQ